MSDGWRAAIRVAAITLVILGIALAIFLIFLEATGDCLPGISPGCSTGD